MAESPSALEEITGRELAEAVTVADAAAVLAYTRAVGDTNSAYPASVEDVGKLVPPTFAAVYAMSPPSRRETSGGGLGIAPQRLVHGEQEFEWRRPVRVGEKLTTRGRIADAYQKRSLNFIVVENTAYDEQGEAVCISRATVLVLPDPAEAKA